MASETPAAAAPCSDTGTRNAFVTRALELIVQGCSGQKRYKDVKDSCTYALAFLKDGRNATAGPATVMSVCFVPLRIAVESKNAKYIEVAIGCLQKLMEYSFITGDMRWVPPKLDGVDAKWVLLVQAWADSATPLSTPAAGAGGEVAAKTKGESEKRQLIHHVVSCICFNTALMHDGVQLQIIKALLTAVSNPACGVHGSTLVMAVRNTFNSYVQSYHHQNQNTAYAALSHMINSVFRRMEAEGLSPEKKAVQASAEDVAHEAANDLDGTVESKTGSDEGNGEGVEAFVRREIVGEMVSGVVGDAAASDAPTGEANGDSEGGGGGGGGGEDEDDDDENFDFDTALAERLAVKAGDIAAASAKENKKPTKVAPGHAGTGGGAGAGHNTSAVSPQGVVAASLGRRGSLALTDRSAGGTMTEADADQMVFQNQYQKDAYLLFYAFSALSDKPIADSAADDSLEMKSKMLSLELLLNILHNAGPVFLGSERFVKTVKKKLCLSLIQHCVSPMLPVFRTSLQLFLSLIGKFKDHLKREIGFFFTNVFFPILDSSNSSYQQKVLVLQVVYKVCEAPQTIIDIFINYDCDIQSVNIFETMVHHLSRLLQGRGFTGTGPEALKQERELGTLALKCLVVILRSIVAWTEKFEVASTTATDVLLGVAGLEASNADEASPLVAAGTAGAGGDDATEVSAASPSHTPSASALLPPPMIREASTGNLSNASPAGRGEDEIERARAYKKEMADYIHTFNTKGAKKALQALWAGGVLEENPRAVAEFFKNQPGLSKDQIGEYFGVLKEFNQKCLSDFVELFNFEGLEIDEAVRKFMSSFRIHGEAQTIDATMEKFAETYTKANQATFPNASTAYVLSFSIIMLHTDAHSVSIKTKMTKEEFFINNRGIDDDKDLPESMLSGIYDRISATPFALEGEDARPTEASKSKRSTGVFGGGVFDRAGDGKRRAINFAEESRAMLRKTKALFKSDKGGSKQFLHASKVEHVRPMFEAAWAAMLPAFSVLLERCGADQQDSIDLCVEGFVKSIHIACLFYLDVERDAFVSALSKLTFLNNLREIEPKNIKSIKALISLAVKEGGYLRSSWFAVLRCFSQLERLQLLGSGAKPDFAFIDEPAPDKRGKRGSLRSHHYSHPAADGGALGASANGAAPSNASLASTGGSSSGVERALGHHGSAPSAASKEKSAAETERERLRLEERNSAIIADQIDEVAISRVYSSTTELSGEAIVYFVRHLCEVSTEELEQSSPPRIFSLQKLIEIADANMGRIRFVWGQLWTHMSRHFIRVGTNRMLGVSMMGIDSLRQLAIKFLEKRELSNYNFQRDFLKPFEIIFQESQSIEVREFVVRCMEQFVEGKAFRVKSGWKTIFSVLASAASDSNEQIVRLAFGPANSSVTKFFPLVAAADAFVDAVNCLIAFSCNTLSTDIAITAIGHLQTCASALADGVLGMSEEKSEGGKEKEKEKEYVIRPLGADDKIDGEDRAQLRVWFPVFTGLGTGATQHPDVSVRLASLNALFAILKAHGSRFTVGMWKVVLSGTVFPIFDNAVCDLCETSTLSAYSPSIAASLSLASAQKHIAQTASASAAANPLQPGAAAGAPVTNGGSSSAGVTTAEPGAIPGGEKGDTRPAPTPPSAPLVPTGSSEVPCSPRTQMAIESADEALKHMSVIEIGLAFLVDLFTEYYQALRHLMGDVLNIILTCCKRPTPLKVANYGVSALVDLVANHCDVPRDALRHNVAGSSSGAAAAAAAATATATAVDGKPGSELQRGRGIQRETNPDDAFGEEEWRILATKLTQTFEAKMLGNRSACLLEIKSTSAQDLGRSAAAGGGGAVASGRSEMTLPTQASISHLTALLNILTTLSLFVQHLSVNWSEETLVSVLGCFQMIHSNPDVLVGGVTSKDVVCLARHCEEKALLLHLRTTLALFVPYTGPERVPGSPSPHSDALRPALYALMRSVLERAAEDRRFDTLANTAVQGLCHMEAAEFERVHPEFYPLLLELITLDASSLRVATRAFFTKVGSQLLRVEGLAPVAFPKARGEGAALSGK